MPIDITVTETRQCCTDRGIKKYLGAQTPGVAENLWFCVHCGQIRRVDLTREPGFERPDVLYYPIAKED